MVNNYSISQDNLDESRNLLLNMTNEEKLGIVEQRRKYLIERLDRLVKNKNINNTNTGHIIEIDSSNDVIDLNFNLNSINNIKENNSFLPDRKELKERMNKLSSKADEQLQ